ncbi:HNH endonuclease signature motif containing protein [Rhodococcus ruber]|uniref:HNH endonuclease signature motif containing protein n=1 Tax=Rhodococcus ruber TaxID=1830 RepID=UPI003784621E
MTSIEERFWSKVHKTTHCWEWIAYKSKSGYGRFGIGSDRVEYAHRVAYELTYGQIRHGMVVDHKCRNRGCVNPDHLHMVSRKQNIENLGGANRNNRSSGVRGVSWSKSVKKWHVYARNNMKTVHGGYFDDIGEAERAAIRLRNTLFTNNIQDRQEGSA